MNMGIGGVSNVVLVKHAGTYLFQLTSAATAASRYNGYAARLYYCWSNNGAGTIALRQHSAEQINPGTNITASSVESGNGTASQVQLRIVNSTGTTVNVAWSITCIGGMAYS